MVVSFDCFGTLVTVDRPDEPAAAVAAELTDRGVDVPSDWADAYREVHIDVPQGAELPLPPHVSAALGSRDVEARDSTVRRSVIAAFDPEVETLPGAATAVEAARDHGHVAVCSNCAVPGLVRRALLRSEVDRDALDCIVTSASCGWRKPDARAFKAVARMLDASVAAITHIGDDPATDGAIADAGGAFVQVDDGIDAAARDRIAAAARETSGGP